MSLKSAILPVGIIQQSKNDNIVNNRDRLAAAARKLAADGARLIVNQELHDSLYFCQTEDTGAFDLATDITEEFAGFYSNLAKELGIVLVTSLFERRAPGLYHNTGV